jgi:hypothetical protein
LFRGCRDGAKAALASYVSLAEFGIPKLARTEIASSDSNPFVVRLMPGDENL